METGQWATTGGWLMQRKIFVVNYARDKCAEFFYSKKKCWILSKNIIK